MRSTATRHLNQIKANKPNEVNEGKGATYPDHIYCYRYCLDNLQMPELPRTRNIRQEQFANGPSRFQYPNHLLWNLLFVFFNQTSDKKM